MQCRLMKLLIFGCYAKVRIARASFKKNEKTVKLGFPWWVSMKQLEIIFMWHFFVIVITRSLQFFNIKQLFTEITDNLPFLYIFFKVHKAEDRGKQIIRKNLIKMSIEISTSRCKLTTKTEKYEPLLITSVRYINSSSCLSRF